MSGWIKLHRQMLDWEWYSDINVMRLFTHCLLRANHKDKQWRGIDIKRGQFYTSLDTLAEETGLTAMQLRTCFSKLEVTGEVTSLGMARGRMVTVVQYDEYQDDNRLNDSLVTGLQQAGNRVATTNNKVNKVKNEKNIDYSVFGMADDQVEEIKRIRKKNKGGSITQRVANGLAKEFNIAIKLGFSVDDLLTEWEVRGWKSFKADWMNGASNGQRSTKQSGRPMSAPERVRAATGQNRVEPNDGSVVASYERDLRE